MIKDDILEYWIESIESLLDEMDKLDLFTSDDTKLMAEALIITAEQESMAFGYDAIPNPQATVIEHLKELHELRNAKLERENDILRQTLADAKKLRVNDIYVENGQVKYLIR